MRMPFGRYKGKPLESIPESYLLWVLDTCENSSPTLQEAIRRQLGVGQGTAQAPPAPQWAEVLGRWYHDLALDFHPDRGGSTEAMQAIIEANERLRRMLGLGRK